MTKSTYLRFWRPDRTANPQGFFIGSSRAEVEKQRWSNSKRTNEHGREKPNIKKLFVETNKLFNGYYQYTILLNLVSKLMTNTSTGTVLEYANKYGSLEKETKNYITMKIDRSREPDIENYIKQSSLYDISQNHVSSIFIIGLISLYDSFLYNLIETVFEESPERTKHIDKQFSVRELYDHGDIESFQRHVVTEYIEDILRQSHYDQFKKLEKILSVNTLTAYDAFHSFIEICERRNLFTHTGGIVNKSYLKKLRDAGLSEDDIKLKEGDQAIADAKYIKNAINITQETAIKIIIVTWYKIKGSSEHSEIEFLANEIAMEFIAERRYEIAIRVLEFMLENKPHPLSDMNRKMMVINICNAMKLSNKDGWKKRLNEEDWTASSNLYQFAKYTVEENLDEMSKLLPSLAREDKISKFALMTWPLFDGVSEKSEFHSMYKNAFGEEFIKLESRRKPNQKED